MAKIVAPLLDAVILNRLESRTLAELRDTLLPKLISGELRVPEAERWVEKAVWEGRRWGGWNTSSILSIS